MGTTHLILPPLNDCVLHCQRRNIEATNLNEPPFLLQAPLVSVHIRHQPTQISSKVDAMDWYSWLSESSLDPGLVSEYALLFSNNELVQDDIAHFDHEFLLSMGVSIGKHRLEILKLAKKGMYRSPSSVARLLAAISMTRSCIAKYVRSFVPRDSSAIVVVPRPPYNGGVASRGNMLKRNKKLVKSKQGELLLTDGGVKVSSPVRVPRKASPMIDRYKEGAEEIRWDSMFQDLKPT
ncbi:hypothetical protein BHE74_00033617 [Ensete ventricosum]|nr:hypothetical protein GW17_00025795 [Ensete ventricosum]RWW59447.1 hypothetical protein BHE74_00033617 [Ensete ventricosum]